MAGSPAAAGRRGAGANPARRGLRWPARRRRPGGPGRPPRRRRRRRL